MDQFPPSVAKLDISQDQLVMESEFAPLTPPSVELSRDSFIYCASEMFRYLRDMALGIPLSQSKPLLRHSKLSPINSPTVTQYASPILPRTSEIDGQPRKFFSGYLVHPGAVLCMMDLLPGIDYDEVITQGNTMTTDQQPETRIVQGDENFPDTGVAMVIEDTDSARIEDDDTETGRQVRLRVHVIVLIIVCVLHARVSFLCHNNILHVVYKCTLCI